MNAKIMGVGDSHEIFTNRYERPLTIELELLSASAKELSRVVLRAERPSGETWTAEVFVGPQRVAMRQHIGENNFLLADDTRSEVDLVPWQELVVILNGLRYIGSFRHALSVSGGITDDLPIGTNFIQEWSRWQGGQDRQVNRRAERVQRDIATLFGYRELKIAVTPDQQDLLLTVDGEPLRLRELGGGIAHFLIVLGVLTMKPPSIVLLDEPELNLHPSLQPEFLMNVAERTIHHSVMYATHSVGLARSTANRVYSLRRQDGRSLMREFEATNDLPEFLGEMSFSAYRELGCNRVLLVEGVNDVLAVRQFLRAIAKEHLVLVLPLNGEDLMRGRTAELSELARLRTPVGVLIDSERLHQDAPLSDLRRGFIEECRGMEFEAHATDRRAFENYLTDEAIKAELGPTFRGLSAFERMPRGALGWSKADNWRIASRMKKEEVLASDLGQFLESL